MIPWSKITLFGDVTITSLVALAIGVMLLADGEKRLALWWMLLFSAGMALVAATKIAYIGCGIGVGLGPLHFSGISGHAMRAAAVPPVLLYLMLKKASPTSRMFGVLCGYGVAMLIGVSRLAVHVHSVSEVVTGWMLGGLVSAAFIRLASPLRKSVFTRFRVSLILLALLPAPYVRPAPTQDWLVSMTLYISGHDRPYQRVEWKQCRPSQRRAIESPTES